MTERRPLVIAGNNVSELPSGDKVSASLIANTPAGNIAATDVQAAINELDTEKLPNTTSLTEIGAPLADDDEVPVYDTSASANRKSLLSRIWTYISGKLASPPAIGGTTPAAGNFTTLGATGNTTLGDASGDTLTINGTAVSIPNNLNFDSNTLFIDAANNAVGIGLINPSSYLGKLGVDGNIAQASGGYHYFWDTANTFGWYIRNASNTLAFGNYSGSQHMTLTQEGLFVGNVGIGTLTFGTSAATVLSIATGTAPTTGPADTVQFYSSDQTAGNTIPSFFCEGSGVTNAAITNTTVTNKIAIRVNGTIYYLLATTSAS